MSLDIGKAFSEGFSRTFAKNGLALVAVFAGIALLTTVLFQTLTVGLTESMLELFQGLSPEEAGLDEQEYDETIAELEMAADEVRNTAPLALGISAGIAAGGLLVLALVAEAASIIAVRVFATENTDGIDGDLATRNILLATLNGFIGGIVVWGLILVGLALFVIPGLFLAVAFYFLRQEIALNDKNFVQAMADSWRLTKGNRIAVFAIGLVLVIVSQFELVGSVIGAFASPLVGALLAAVLAGVLGVFGAAVVTRAYVQLDDGDDAEANEPDEDPYAAALGPDDLPK